LSYTTFTYDRLRLDRTKMDLGGQLQVTVTVTNSGKRAGTEVVQLYTRDLVGSVTRPVKELKGFQRIELQPGESRDVTFTLHAADLAFHTANGRWEAEPGEFKVFVGTNSRDVSEAGFELR
jgi:beta-glucosidase